MKYIMYTDAEGKVRWKLVARNGRIVADSGEGYNGVGNCHRAIKMFRAMTYEADVVDETKEGAA